LRVTKTYCEQLIRLMTAFKTFFRLPLSEKRLFVLAAPVVVGVRLALWLLPSALIVRATRRIANPQARSRPARAVSMMNIVEMVEAVSRRVPRASCLTQALSAQILLWLHGYSATLCLGVAHGADQQFQAHAWLERDGKILIGRSRNRYARLPDLAATLAAPSLQRHHS
jgi:hypothetical protein